MPRNLLITPSDDADTEGHGWRYEFTPEDGDEWLDRLERRGPESAPVRIRLADDDSDTEGHLASTALRLVVQGDDDTEGHAISVHFPSVEEADRFRRRLLATGVLVGAVALGATSGALLSQGQQADAGAAAGAGTVAAEQVSGEYAADRGVGVAPDAASGAAAERVSGEYAADRGAGISPQVAAENETLDGNPNTDVMPR